MNEEVKYCFYCGMALNPKAKFCAGCGTHLEEDTEIKIQEPSTMETSPSSTQSDTGESTSNQVNPERASNKNDLGLAVGAALMMGHRHRIYRKMDRRMRRMRRAKRRNLARKRRMMLQYNRMMRRR